MLKISGFHILADLITGVIVTLFLWNKMSFAAALEFRILELLTIPVATVVVGWMVDRVSAKLSFLVGLLLLLIEVASLWLLGNLEILEAWLWLPAVFSGTSAVARFLSLNIMIQASVAVEKQPVFFANSTIIWQVLSVVFPIVSGVVIANLGYRAVFAVAVLVIVFLMALVFFVKSRTHRNPFQPLRYLKTWQSVDRILAQTYFFWGVEFAFFSVVLPVLIARAFGGEQAWGVVAAGLAAVAIGFNLLAKKNWSAQLPQMLGLVGFTLSIVALWYAVNPALWLFCGLLIVVQIWQATQSLALKPLANRDIEHRSISTVFRTEMSLFLEWPFMAGRLVSLLVVFGVEPLLNQAWVVGVLFVLVSLVPLYEMKIFWSRRHSGTT